MVTQFTARLHRWRCLFYSNLQLAWFARVVVSKFLASRIIAASVDLSRRLFCALELVCWSDCATQFPGFVAKFADCAFGCGRVGDARMDSRLALHRFRLEWAWRRAAFHLAAYSNCGTERRDRLVVRYCVRKRHRGDNAAPFVSGSQNASGAAAF